MEWKLICEIELWSWIKFTYSRFVRPKSKQFRSKTPFFNFLSYNFYPKNPLYLNCCTLLLCIQLNRTVSKNPTVNNRFGQIVPKQNLFLLSRRSEEKNKRFVVSDSQFWTIVKTNFIKSQSDKNWEVVNNLWLADKGKRSIYTLGVFFGLFRYSP